MADWFSVSGKYGGGGMGGGEPVNNTFIEPSNGGAGEAYMITVKTYPVDCSNKFSVNVNGNVHRIINLKNKNTSLSNLAWHDLRRNLSTPHSRDFYNNRHYQLLPLKIDKSINYEYVELSSIDGFNQDIGLVESKIIHDNSPLKVLYSKSNNENNCLDIEVDDLWLSNSGTNTGSIGSLNRTDYIYVMLQAGGGGGGGADNTWGLFNYASGGGGGGAGAACCFKITVNHAIYNYELVVGAKGVAGQNKNYGTVGGNGGNTSLTIKDSNNNILAQVVVSGGAGGTGGAGNSGGTGGAGGTQTTFIDNAGILTQLCIVNGGAGGNAGKAGNACSASGIWTDTIETGLFNVVFSADQKFGTPGALVGADDKGGAGGASWLGNGGFYSDEAIISGF